MKQIILPEETLAARGKARMLGSALTALVLAACAFAPRASATIFTLNPGGNQNPADGSLYGFVGTVVGTTNYSFDISTASGALVGTLTSTVYSGDTSSPYNHSGGLTFTYLLTISGTGTDPASLLTADSFAGFNTDVSYNSNSVPSGIVPSFFSRTPGSGDILSFSWQFNNIQPGQTGDLIVVQTDATTFGIGTGGVTDGGANTVTILAPVPEPAIGSLIATGMGALFISRRRNSK